MELLLMVAKGVDVGAKEIVETGGEEPFGIFLGLSTVHSRQRGKVELEENVHTLEALVVGTTHVDIALRVGQNGCVATVLDALQTLVEVHGWVEVRGLDQQVLVIAQGKQVVGLQTLVKEIVNHVLGGQVEVDASFVGLF